LVGPDAGTSFELGNQPVFIGRSPKNDVRLTDEFVSRNHLTIRNKNSRYFVEDLWSKNGTYVNGIQIEPGIEIEVNELHPIVIGMSVICLGENSFKLVRGFLNSVTSVEASAALGGNDTLDLPDSS